jgi:hypothetical protein
LVGLQIAVQRSVSFRCPNNRGDRTVQVIHGVDGDKSTAFSFQITTVRYFPEEISMIYIHCDVVLCSIAGGRRSEGFIKVISLYCETLNVLCSACQCSMINDASPPRPSLQCHTRTFCTEEGAVLNGNLEPLATQEVKHVLSGPLRTLENVQGTVGNSVTRPGKKLRYLTQKICACPIGQHKT